MGLYRETLGGLIPYFVIDLPHDVISSWPLNFRRTSNGRLAIYSVCREETDNGEKRNRGLGPGTSSNQVLLGKPFPNLPTCATTLGVGGVTAVLSTDGKFASI